MMYPSDFILVFSLGVAAGMLIELLFFYCLSLLEVVNFESGNLSNDNDCGRDNNVNSGGSK